MIKFKTIQVIEVQDWDDLVVQTYGRPYSFQQQDGCQSRGMIPITIPESLPEDYEEEFNDSIPEVINGEKMKVKFSSWLSRDPKAPIPNEKDYFIELFWHRNFYPDLQVVANDLHSKSLIPAGKYEIEIDW